MEVDELIQCSIREPEESELDRVASDDAAPCVDDEAVSDDAPIPSPAEEPADWLRRVSPLPLLSPPTDPSLSAAPDYLPLSSPPRTGPDDGDGAPPPPVPAPADPPPPSPTTTGPWSPAAAAADALLRPASAPPEPESRPVSPTSSEEEGEGGRGGREGRGGEGGDAAAAGPPPSSRGAGDARDDNATPSEEDDAPSSSRAAVNSSSPAPQGGGFAPPPRPPDPDPMADADGPADGDPRPGPLGRSYGRSPRPALGPLLTPSSSTGDLAGLLEAARGRAERAESRRARRAIDVAVAGAWLWLPGALAVAAWLAASSLVVLLQRAAIVDHGFSYPFLLSASGSFAAGLASAGLAAAADAAEAVRRSSTSGGVGEAAASATARCDGDASTTRRRRLGRLFPASALGAAALWTGNLSYQHLPSGEGWGRVGGREGRRGCARRSVSSISILSLSVSRPDHVISLLFFPFPQP